MCIRSVYLLALSSHSRRLIVYICIYYINRNYPLAQGHVYNISLIQEDFMGLLNLN